MEDNFAQTCHQQLALRRPPLAAIPNHACVRAQEVRVLWSASMELINWLLTSLAYVGGLIWSLIWFLISGWVSTLLQIAVLIAVIYWLKYGWQRAPFEVWRRTRSFGRFFWSWIRGRDPEPRAHDEVVRLVRLREFGDVNVSTLLSLATLVGLILVAPLR